jgi:hypothetical protein
MLECSPVQLELTLVNPLHSGNETKNKIICLEVFFVRNGLNESNERAEKPYWAEKTFGLETRRKNSHIFEDGICSLFY